MDAAVSPADHLLARDLATRAGHLLVELRATMILDGCTADELRTAGDERSHEFLMAELSAMHPADAVLSEESESESAAATAARVASIRTWIVDPLDGTREFGEPGRSDWAVHVALCLDGDPLVGAVALPALGVTYSTVTAPITPAPTTPAVGRTTRVVVSRSRPPAAAVRIAERLGAELIEMGSAGAKAMSILRGEADIYPHEGGQYEWDSCAPVAVARAAGLWCSRIDGSALRYNNADPYLPDLLICRPEMAAGAIDAADSTR